MSYCFQPYKWHKNRFSKLTWFIVCCCCCCWVFCF